MQHKLPMAQYQTVIMEALKKSPEEFARIFEQVQAARASDRDLSDILASTGIALYQLANNMMEAELTGSFRKCSLGEGSRKQEGEQDKMDVENQNQASPPQTPQWSSYILNCSSQGQTPNF